MKRGFRMIKAFGEEPTNTVPDLFCRHERRQPSQNGVVGSIACRWLPRIIGRPKYWQERSDYAYGSSPICSSNKFVIHGIGNFG